eukprot:gene36319-biopygen2095
MIHMFGDFDMRAVVLFDNVLLLAHDEHACQQHNNVFLKMPKSWFGFPSVKFFGYKVTYNKRDMDADRKQTIMEFRIPTCQKELQSFLGAALFLKSFVPNHSGIASELNKMTHKDLNWKQETWTYD